MARTRHPVGCNGDKLGELHKQVADILITGLNGPKPPTVAWLSAALCFLAANSSRIPRLDDETRTRLEQLYPRILRLVTDRIDSGAASSRDLSVGLQLLKRYEESPAGRLKSQEEIRQALQEQPLRSIHLPFPPK